MTTESEQTATVNPEEMAWDGVFETNWHPLSNEQVTSWQNQVKWAIPDIRKGELTEAMLRFAQAEQTLNRDGKRTAPRPKQIIDNILKHRRFKGEGVNQPDYRDIRAGVMAACEEQDWQKVSDLIRDIRNIEARVGVEREVFRLYPEYVPVWPDETCLAYERLHGRKCPYWRKDCVREAITAVEPEGPLAKMVGETVAF